MKLQGSFREWRNPANSGFIISRPDGCALIHVQDVFQSRRDGVPYVRVGDVLEFRYGIHSVTTIDWFRQTVNIRGDWFVCPFCEESTGYLYLTTEQDYGAIVFACPDCQTVVDAEEHKKYERLLALRDEDGGTQ